MSNLPVSWESLASDTQSKVWNYYHDLWYDALLDAMSNSVLEFYTTIQAAKTNCQSGSFYLTVRFYEDIEFGKTVFDIGWSDRQLWIGE